MAATPPDPDIGRDAGTRPDGGPHHGTPRWVKVFGIIAAVAVLLLVILLLTGRGHGPARHTGFGDAAGRPATAGVIADRAPLGGGPDSVPVAVGRG